MRPTWASLGQTIAVSVATILGTGILGLPVALHTSGIRPFLFLFTLNLFAQIGVVFATTELLQRALQKSLNEPASTTLTEKSMTTATDNLDDNDDVENAARTETQHEQQTDNNTNAALEHTPITAGTASINTMIHRSTRTQNNHDEHDSPPSLHSLAKNYISSPPLRLVFNAMVMGHFIFIMVAYVLAAPQAYAAIIPFLSNVPVYMRTTVFLFCFSAVVYFLTSILLPSLSIGTLVKAVLLTFLVALTLDRGLTIRHTVTSNWAPQYLIDPLLMGTIALSGVVNLMPVTFQTCFRSLSFISSSASTNLSVLADRSFVSAYRTATVVALFICYGLNVAWVYAVLLVVPQTSDVAGKPSLSDANEKGEISTIPLMQVLQASHDRLNGIVAILVNLFIAISVTISFLVMSVGMLHFMRGSVKSSNNDQDENNEISSNQAQGWMQKIYRSLFVRYWIGGVAVVYLIALLNPAGLLRIMEGVTTLALNLEAGFFVMYMFYVSRTAGEVEEESFNAGYLSSSRAAIIITYLGLYFSVAILVDMIFYIPPLVFG